MGPISMHARHGVTARFPTANFRHEIRLAAEHRRHWRDDRISLISQVWYMPRDNVFLKLGYSFGVAEQKESFLRAALEVEF